MSGIKHLDVFVLVHLILCMKVGSSFFTFQLYLIGRHTSEVEPVDRIHSMILPMISTLSLNNSLSAVCTFLNQSHQDSLNKSLPLTISSTILSTIINIQNYLH